MKQFILIIAVLVLPALVMGQNKKFEYTPKVKNKIVITNLLGSISIQNTSGNVIIIESDFDLDRPERADGLRLLGSAEDNTNLGLNIGEENGMVNIQGVNNQVRDYKYKISVPAGMSLNLDYSSPFCNGDIAVDGYAGSLEVKTLNANVKITNSEGPFTVNSISGNVEVVFNKLNQTEPTSLASVSGFIDLTLPSTEKATFEISNLTGNIFNNLDLKGVAVKNRDNRASGLEPVKQQGGDVFNLNGGGQKLFLKAISGNIYLRKR